MEHLLLGAGWIYSPEYYPSGETLFATGASFNIGNYFNAQLNADVQKTDFGTASLGAFANLMAVQLPDLYQPNTTNDFVAGGIGEVINTLKSRSASRRTRWRPSCRSTTPSNKVQRLRASSNDERPPKEGAVRR